MPRPQAKARSRARHAATTDLPAQPSQGLIDGLTLLQALAVSDEPAGVRELARRLEWNAMRVNRLLKTLAGLGLARQTHDRRYTAGPAMHVLSVQSLYASGLLRRAVEAAATLPCDRHSLALGVLWQDQVCYLFHARPGQSPAAATGAHALYPATQSSIGMILLAALPDSEVRHRYAHRSAAPFESIDDLLTELERIRQVGYAYVEQAQRPLQASVAVPIGMPPYAALAMARSLTPLRVKRLLPKLRAAASAIAAG